MRAVVARVAGGDDAVVLLRGLPGVGKSRLAQETLRIAELAGFTSLSGRCDTLSTDVAFAPLVQAFGEHLRAMTGPRRDRLLGDLPQLGLLFAGFGLATPPPLGDPTLERARLTEGFVSLVYRLAREQPLALLIDDVQAADAETAVLLRRLMAAPDQPVLLVCTAPSGGPGAGAADLLASDLADPALRVEHVRLDALPATAAARLAGELLGAPIDERLAELITERCAGRPLLIDALTRTLAEAGSLEAHDGLLGLKPGSAVPLPSGVQAQLRVRLASAGEDEQAVLRVLGVAGEADVDVLLRAVDLPADRILDALDRLYGRGLCATTPTRRWTLAHGLLRETLLAGLSPATTQRVHAALASALGSGPGSTAPESAGGLLLQVADHVLAAGPLLSAGEAFDHLRRGAAHAARLGRTDAVVRYLTGAADIARADEFSADLPGVLADLAMAWQRLSKVDRATAVWHEAADAYRTRGDALGVARTERALAMLAWDNGDISAARERLDIAERTIDGLEPGSEHAWLLYTRVVTGIRLGDVDAVRAAAGRLRALAGELGEASILAHAHLAEGALRYAETDYVAAAAADRRGLESALRSGEPMLVLRAHDQLSVVAGAHLDLAGLREHSTAGVELAHELGSPSLAGWPRGRLVCCDLLSGEWDAALRASSDLAAEVGQTDGLRGNVSVLAIRSWVLTWYGRVDAARQALKQAVERAGQDLRADRNIFAIVALGELQLSLADDHPIDDVSSRYSVLAEPTSGWLPLLGLAALGHVCVRRGDLQAARRLRSRLQTVRSCATAAPTVLGDWLAGLIDAAEGDLGCGADRMLSAAAGFDTLGLPFHAARALLAAANAAERRPGAIDEARAALAVFDRLGAAREAELARTFLRSHGITPSRGRGHRSTGSVLSSRELEVARLVATGRSNADVATVLFISPRTVSTHLDRIYAKLQLSSRAALTRYLADSGLLESRTGY